MTDPKVERTDLTSGVRVVTERMPEVSSVSLGVWVAVGSRDEPKEIAGVSHFLEHLLFKGTDTRSAREIAASIDAVGGEMNAYTSREHTAYYLRLPSTHQQLGFDLLADVLAQPALRQEDLDCERDVIYEELLMAEDTPDDLVITHLYDRLFSSHPLGRETLGDQKTVMAMQRDDVANFHFQWYRPKNMVVAAAGAIDHDQVVKAFDGFLTEGTIGETPQRQVPQPLVDDAVQIDRPIEQVHLAVGWRSVSLADEDRYALYIANQVLGGGMSSRLFQQVREERGLVYTIYSAPSLYSDTGSVVLYAGTAVNRLGELLGVCESLLEDFVRNGITDSEYDIALGYLEGSMVLGLEDSGSRLSRLGNGIVARNDVVSIDEHIRQLRAVTPADVAAVIAKVFAAPRVVSAVGPLGDGIEALPRFARG